MTRPRIPEEVQIQSMEPLVDEIREHHPELWAKVYNITPLAALPIINDYTGCNMQPSTPASVGIAVWVEALKARRPRSVS